MENFYVILGALAVIIFFVITLKSTKSREEKKVFKNNVYSYHAKPLMMSQAEVNFFIMLNAAVNERYFVFPQVHLSALFDHKIEGQEWRFAFRHINGKSVDYVLCDKQTLRPVYAIELDDYTHNRPERKERDAEVERIFKDAGLPLVRFENGDVTEAEIIQQLSDHYATVR